MTKEELEKARRDRAAAKGGPAPSSVAPQREDLRLVHRDFGIPTSLPTDPEGQEKLCLALRAAGLKAPQIAEILHVSRQYVYRMLKRSKEERREQWDDFLAQNAIPRALDNLVEGLDEKDKDYTLRTLEAVGVLGKGRTDGDGGGSKQFAFQVNIVSPKGQQTTFVEGRIVGQPREPEEQNDRDEIGESGRPDLGRAANRQLREGDRAAAPGAPGADPSADS